MNAYFACVVLFGSTVVSGVICLAQSAKPPESVVPDLVSLDFEIKPHQIQLFLKASTPANFSADLSEFRYEDVKLFDSDGERIKQGPPKHKPGQKPNVCFRNGSVAPLFCSKLVLPPSTSIRVPISGPKSSVPIENMLEIDLVDTGDFWFVSETEPSKLTLAYQHPSLGKGVLELHFTRKILREARNRFAKETIEDTPIRDISNPDNIIR